MTDRRSLLLDAAIDVLGTRGMRALTHRAVDAAAALPPGSTSNHFRTREALLAGVLRRILEREQLIWAGRATEVSTLTAPAVASALGLLVEQLTTTDRVLSQARRAIFVEAAVQPALGAEIGHLQEEVGGWLEPLLDSLGSGDPAGDTHHLLALLDGLVVNQLTIPRADFDPTRAVAALLDGLTTNSA